MSIDQLTVDSRERSSYWGKLNTTLREWAKPRCTRVYLATMLQVMVKAKEVNTTQKPRHPLKGQLVGYVRVSAFDKNENRQLEGVQIDRVFLDKASGKDVNRPQLELMLGFVRGGDTIICHSMDRLGRNLDEYKRQCIETPALYWGSEALLLQLFQASDLSRARGSPLTLGEFALRPECSGQDGQRHSSTEPESAAERIRAG